MRTTKFTLAIPSVRLPAFPSLTVSNEIPKVRIPFLSLLLEPRSLNKWLCIWALCFYLAFCLGCNSCHSGEATARGPNLAQVYGSRLQLQDGSYVTANDAFLRETILNPSTRVTAGYAPIMPTYQGQVSEEGLIDLVEYIKNLNSNYRIQQTLTASQLSPGQAGASSSGTSSPAMNYRTQETLGAGHGGPAKAGKAAPSVPGTVNQ